MKFFEHESRSKNKKIVNIMIMIIKSDNVIYMFLFIVYFFLQNLKIHVIYFFLYFIMK